MVKHKGANISFCSNECPIGKAARDSFLDVNNSAIDAAIDFNFFIEKCIRSCPYLANANNL